MFEGNRTGQEIEQLLAKVAGILLSGGTITIDGQSITPITHETDPTVPAWAKASSKPTYTASEVGAVSISDVGVANGVCPLNASGIVDSSYLPQSTQYVVCTQAQYNAMASHDSNTYYLIIADNA